MNDVAFKSQIRSEEVSALRKRKQEIERECEYLNECATDAFESRGWPMSVTLDCDCHVTRTELSGERGWKKCNQHEELPL
jgi:hypothetical protein